MESLISEKVATMFPVNCQMMTKCNTAARAKIQVNTGTGTTSVSQLFYKCFTIQGTLSNYSIHNDKVFWHKCRYCSQLSLRRSTSNDVCGLLFSPLFPSSSTSTSSSPSQSFLLEQFRGSKNLLNQKSYLRKLIKGPKT